MILVLDAEDRAAPLPCGCPLSAVKVYEEGRALPGVVRVEVRRGSAIDGTEARWRVTEQALEDGKPMHRGGHVLLTVRIVPKLELRCAHNPKENAP